MLLTTFSALSRRRHVKFQIQFLSIHTFLNFVQMTKNAIILILKVHNRIDTHDFLSPMKIFSRFIQPKKRKNVLKQETTVNFVLLHFTFNENREKTVVRRCTTIRLNFYFELISFSNFRRRNKIFFENQNKYSIFDRKILIEMLFCFTSARRRKTIHVYSPSTHSTLPRDRRQLSRFPMYCV